MISLLVEKKRKFTHKVDLILSICKLCVLEGEYFEHPYMLPAKRRVVDGPFYSVSAGRMGHFKIPAEKVEEIRNATLEL